jgi:hypothetical protein
MIGTAEARGLCCLPKGERIRSLDAKQPICRFSPVTMLPEGPQYRDSNSDCIWPRVTGPWPHLLALDFPRNGTNMY